MVIVGYEDEVLITTHLGCIHLYSNCIIILKFNKIAMLQDYNANWRLIHTFKLVDYNIGTGDVELNKTTISR